VRGELFALRDHLAMVTKSGQAAIRTPAWNLILDRTARQDFDAHSPAKLYAKPSDRWEVNEVADRCPEVTAALKDALLHILTQGDQEIPPLAEILVTEVD